MEQRPFPRLCALWLSLLLFALPSLSQAAEFRIESDTLLRMFEGTVDGDEELAIPIYEYLQADLGIPGEQPLTFHLYGWGRIDLSGGDYFEERFAGGDDTAGELLYGYLQYEHPDTSLAARLGRQYVFGGVANESIDGLRLSADLPWFSFSAYGGLPVGVDTADGRSGDSIFGGRIAHRWSTLYEIGLSYKNLENDGNLDEEMLGLDFSLYLPGGMDLYGFSARNLESDGWAEHYYQASLNLGPLQIRPYFEYFRYEDYFATGANTGRPFRFLDGIDERLTVIGADILFIIDEKWEWGVKGKHYDYDERGDSSQFFSGLFTWHGEGMTQAGGELGWMNGDAAENEYLLGRTFIYCDRPENPVLKFFTTDLVYVWYDEDIYNEDASFFISVGTGTRLLNDALELKVSADYNSDPYFDDDLRGWLLASYAFSL